MTIPDPLPQPLLVDDNLMLRQLGLQDADSMLFGLDDEQALKLTGTQRRFTPDQVRAHCARVAGDPDRIDYAITLGGNAAVGEVVLNSLDRQNRLMWFRVAIWRDDTREKGLGTRAARLVLDHAFDTLGLNRIELEVYAFNTRAKHVYEKLGFRVEGRRREAMWWGNEAVDAIGMGLLAADYMSRRAGAHG